MNKNARIANGLHTDSSIRVAKFFLYRMAVRMFILAFFLFALGPESWRLSETVWRARPLADFPA
jgi:hypothetical protein